jgi:hypothetical protein
VLFDFSLKAESRRPMTERVVVVQAEALPLALTCLANKGKRGSKAPRRTSVERAVRSAIAKGHGRRSTTAVADRILENV